MSNQLVQIRSSLSPDGRRNHVHPADVHGRFTTARKLVFLVLIAIYFALPWIPVGGHPAVFLDINTRHFYLFGMTFNATDVWLMTFLLTGAAFSLVVVSSLLGRVWCGWACPQTVFLEAFYRRVERWLEGPREKRLRRNAGPWTFDKTWRKVVKQVAFVLISATLAHVAISYFVSLPALFDMMRHKPAEHPEAFAVVMGFTGVLYFNFAWFREQFCVVLCPYGRLQSVLLDQDSLIVGYDATRGEPRGKAKQEGVGDCVDCGRCVTVCPTGIDIRNGLQLDCIACTQCIDACDEIMDKLERPRGLIRYDSQKGLAGGKTKILRARLAFYGVLLVIGAGVASFAFAKRTDVEANLLRQKGMPFLINDGKVQNQYNLYVANKRNVAVTFRLEPETAPAFDGTEYIMPIKEVHLEPLESVKTPVFVAVPRDQWVVGKSARASVRVVAEGEPKPAAVAAAPFVGP